MTTTIPQTSSLKKKNNNASDPNPTCPSFRSKCLHGSQTGLLPAFILFQPETPEHLQITLTFHLYMVDISEISHSSYHSITPTPSLLSLIIIITFFYCFTLSIKIYLVFLVGMQFLHIIVYWFCFLFFLLFKLFLINVIHVIIYTWNM